MAPQLPTQRLRGVVNFLCKVGDSPSIKALEITPLPYSSLLFLPKLQAVRSIGQSSQPARGNVFGECGLMEQGAG